MQLLRSLLFTTSMFLSVLPYALVLMTVALFDHDRAYRIVVAWARAVDRLARLFCGLSFEVEGKERLPGQNSVVLMKHSSAYETIMQILIFPRQTWVLKRELMRVPFFGWALKHLEPIAIDRAAGSGAVQQVLDQGQQRLLAGRWVMVFPEGTRMPPGETRRYGLSGTLLAQRAGRLIVPVAHNAGDFWPRRGWRKRAGTVRFCIGPPFDPAGQDPRELNARVQAWIEDKVAELRGGTGQAADD